MKILAMLILTGGISVVLSACQNGGAPSHNDTWFAEKTHRTYNPLTGDFEQSPPFGKQSNKDE